MADKTRHIVDKDALPEEFPTHCHPPEFWEALGRLAATFGFLEYTLARAIFALTATREYASEEELDKAYSSWVQKLENALSDTLKPLVDTFATEVRQHQSSTISNLDELIDGLKQAATYRNVFLHAYWPPPDTCGFCVPFFVDRKIRKGKKDAVFNTPIDVDSLKRTQKFAAKLSVDVVNVVTHMGYQFPGSGGPGKKVWPDNR